MATTFHYFTLEEVYQYAEKMGYSREDVEIECYDEDGYDVSFGREDTEIWSWDFEDLTQPAVDYEHLIWED